MRTTVARIAREAGVSPATVDRALNNRDGVRPRTRDIVLQVAARLGYFGPAAQETPPRVRLAFVLPVGTNTFLHTLRRHLIEESQARGDCDVSIHQIESFEPARLADEVLSLRGTADAAGLVAPDHPEVREAINTLANSGVKTCTMVSDIHTVKKVGYVGIDNRAAGRLAGLLLGRFLPAGDGEHRVALFMGSLAYRGHEEREMGFRSILAEEFRRITIAGHYEVSDDRELAYRATLRMLDAGEISAIYSIGAGNQGIARALRERRLERRIVFIGHDLTDATRIMLLDRTIDAVIEQNPKVQAREAIRLLVSAVNGKSEPDYPPRLQVIFRENIPAI
ncbi:LacI family DNA-binding transcriptional regulator [Tropicimonas sp.]|uniref:LacI family DNA-binding transcriptional regulator n=1 Tax=Tropicimonas sp. TaxID=2067044 RepID=UPI003A8C0A40